MTRRPAVPARARRLSDIVPEPVEYLMPGYLPVGTLIVIQGPPGVGKSTVTLGLSATLTAGSPLPGGVEREPMKVVIVNPEDPYPVIQARVQAAEGDLDRVLLIDQPGPRTHRPVDLSRDLPRLRSHFEDPEIGLVVFDNITLALGRGGRTEMGTREALFPLGRLAQETSTTVIGVRHLRKGRGPALERGAGFVAIAGTARCVAHLSVDPHDPDARVLETVKTNFGPPPEPQGCRIVDDGHGPYIEWTGPTERTADQGLRSTTSPKLDAACDLLLDLLDRGPVRKSDIEQAAARQDISPRTVEAAKSLLGVRSRQVPEPGVQGPGPSWWSLADLHTGADPREGAK